MIWNYYQYDKQKRREEALQKATPAGYYKTTSKCISCDGSGCHDHNGSPRCGACRGTGKDSTYIKRGEEVPEWMKKRYKRY